MSYSHFEYSKLRIPNASLAAGEPLRFEVELRNAGARAGTEVVQVYVSDLVTSLTWVEKSLLAFQRVTLEAGEQRVLQFSIPFEGLALVDAYERRRVEPGEFEIAVARSANDPDALRGRFVVAGEPFSFSGIPGIERR